MTHCRVVVTPPASGAWNMAVDEALLEQTRVTATPVLRLYRWEAATLSLGYFQPIAAAQAFRERPIVRRLSGGGAILHHHEITYSLCLPPRHPLAARPNDLYRAVHEGIATALSELGVNVYRRGEAVDVNSSLPSSRLGTHSSEAPLRKPDAALEGKQSFQAAAAKRELGNEGQEGTPGHEQLSTLNFQLSTFNSEPFLCFLRESPDDLLLRGSKLVGSAQRRRRGAHLQHGSLILATSPYAPEVAGLQQLAGAELPFEWDERVLAASVLASLGLSPALDELDEVETAQGARLAETKYGSREWNFRR